ncbi:MAG: 16S rRNA (guanine(527)-N(7))-methyltransferase RsmG [Alphaproteobacteria bacterium]
MTARGRRPEPEPLGPEGFAAAAGVSRETLGRLEAYADLLRKWQESINLVGPATLVDLWRRHMLDSAQLVDYLPADPGPERRVVADLGSGAGFPGLVLAILGAGHVHLIESSQKKCAFLREVARITGAKATVHAARIEDIARVLPFGPADVVTSRALARLIDLLALAKPMLTPVGVCLLLKGAHVDEELTAARKEWNMRVEEWPSATGGSGTILRVAGLRLGGTSIGKSGN